MYLFISPSPSGYPSLTYAKNTWTEFFPLHAQQPHISWRDDTISSMQITPRRTKLIPTTLKKGDNVLIET